MMRPPGWPGWNNATRDQRTAAIEEGMRDGHTMSAIASALRTTKNAICGHSLRHIVPDPQRAHERRVASCQANGERRRDEARQRLAPLAEKIRALVAEGHGIRGAGAILGLTRDKARYIAALFEITLTPEQLRAVLVRNAAKGGAALAAKTRKQPGHKPPSAQSKRLRIIEDAAPRLMRNPKLSAAQQAMVDGIKEASWQRVDRRLLALPRVTDDEAARLIAQHIAKHGVTKCPPPVEMQEPINYGVGWGMRKPR